LAETARALQSFYRFFERYARITESSFYAVNPATGASDDIAPLRTRFFECMDDDFNTGGAVGVLFELLSVLNRGADANKLEDPSAPHRAKVEFTRGVGVLRELSSVLGLFWEPVAAPQGDVNLLTYLQTIAGDLGVSQCDDIGATMDSLIQARADARKAKNFALGDQIRKRLADLGVTLEDRPGGKTDWRVG
jgi:cysteinyl-tRNA synthetase